MNDADPHAQLMEFYEVKTVGELIAAMEQHIVRLQAKATPVLPYMTTRTPREG